MVLFSIRWVLISICIAVFIMYGYGLLITYMNGVMHVLCSPCMHDIKHARREKNLLSCCEASTWRCPKLACLLILLFLPEEIKGDDMFNLNSKQLLYNSQQKLSHFIIVTVYLFEMKEKQLKASLSYTFRKDIYVFWLWNS